MNDDDDLLALAHAVGVVDDDTPPWAAPLTGTIFALVVLAGAFFSPDWNHIVY